MILSSNLRNFGNFSAQLSDPSIVIQMILNLIEEDNFLMDEQQIASIFNDFFVNVASNVYEPDNDPPSNGFSDHSSILHIKSFM